MYVEIYLTEDDFDIAQSEGRECFLGTPIRL